MAKEWSEQLKSLSGSSIQQPVPTSTQPRLNPSQQKAVNYMISSNNNHRITLIQGPPGTGKTSMIAAFVQYALCYNKGGIWIVAQSNVAVKNIAEKLMSIGFENWRHLASENFHLWHEHLYPKIKKNIIFSNTFYSAASKSNLRDFQVILCTLSMLSNPNIYKFTKEIPLKAMIVDEASQIEVGNYISIFTNFKQSLCKVCFIGDDKQLPPYGQEDLGDLQSIFEFPHLQKHIVFLDTQSCYFVEALGKERPLDTGSLMNKVEACHIIHLARKLQEQKRNYQIITPYDGQTRYIENLMKTEGLEWGDKYFSVDSFQERVLEWWIPCASCKEHGPADITNGYLGMFIVSTPHFLTEVAKGSLIGQFMKKVFNPTWLTKEDIPKEKFWQEF
ncbi:P-loop containing nucleoside triphosphate hydrolase protein [Phlegmacium glaucopus]|nr:P-loop containing nucleoside triphosphate hydrolase protein [Phlegmacium glaucopus]